MSLGSGAPRDGCAFCGIISGSIETKVVWEDEHTVTFLDRRPVFPGHCLVVPRAHYETLPELPAELLVPMFSTARLVASAMPQGLGADGTFVGINNVVSQSVPHMHVHVVPRRFKDGLRGFFWPRRPYADDDEAEQFRRAVRSAIQGIKTQPPGS